MKALQKTILNLCSCLTLAYNFNAHYILYFQELEQTVEEISKCSQFLPGIRDKGDRDTQAYIHVISIMTVKYQKEVTHAVM